ncbi:hypothetical protein JW988_06905 [Candidatus Bathyarchaeota archaeon]|nr:hypothetical protein [Candidatus Bathyarchaeota archaeon]
MNLIVGGGKYGCYAIEYLRQKGKDFLVVDTNPNCLAIKRFSLKTFELPASNRESFVNGGLPKVLELIGEIKPEYVFPTAPVHIAADLAKLKFNLVPWSEAITDILPRLPEVVVLHAENEKLVVSFNKGHECIEKCSMPEVCPSSGIKKPCTMTKLMRFASPEAFMLISYSMAPGLGALKGSELSELFKWAETKERFIVATACDCHGVFSAFQKRDKT